MPDFSVERDKRDEVEFIRLIDAGRRGTVSIAPEFGGNIYELVLSKNGNQYSLIDGFRTREEFILNQGYNGAKLLPFANRIADGVYKFGGREYRLPINEPERSNANHGFFHRRPMFEESATATDYFAEVALRYEYTGDYDGYPFPFRTRLLYKLGSEGLTITTEVTNTGRSAMPLGDGWHPYFRLGETIDGLTLRLPAAHEITLNERMIPLRNQPDAGYSVASIPLHGVELDSLFDLNINKNIATTKLYSETDGPAIHIWQETGNGKYNYLCVYTPPHRKSIAIEPMTGAINAFNNGLGLIVLDPGESFSASFGVSVF